MGGGCLPNEEGGSSRRGGRRGGGCVGDGCWESRLAGAPQSAGRHGAAAAAAGDAGGVDWGLQGCDIPVCISHQTLGLWTHRFRDKTANITHKFHSSSPPSFHSITPPVPQMDMQLLQPASVSRSQQYPQQRVPCRTARMHHSLILATLWRLLWL